MRTQTAVVIQIVDTQISNNYTRANYRHGLWIFGQLVKSIQTVSFHYKIAARLRDNYKSNSAFCY